MLLSLQNRIGGDRPVFLIDVGYPDGEQPAVTAVGELSPELLQLRLPQARRLVEPLASTLSEDYAAFASKPGIIRLLIDGTLTGASIEATDARILSRLSSDWAPLSRTAGQIPGAFGSGGFRDLDYVWLLWRLEELRKSGRIERRGGSFDPEFMDNPLGGDVRLLT